MSYKMYNTTLFYKLVDIFSDDELMEHDLPDAGEFTPAKRAKRVMLSLVELGVLDEYWNIKDK